LGIEALWQPGTAPAAGPSGWRPPCFQGLDWPPGKVGADAAANCPLHTAAAGLAGGKGKERSPKEEGPGIAEGAHSQEGGELQNQGGGGVVALG
jgi:hypothetical protein